MLDIDKLTGLAKVVRCPKCGATTTEATACAYPGQCFHKGKTTSEGLHAVRNHKLKQWEYYRLTATGYVKTGSTEHFQY